MLNQRQIMGILLVSLVVLLPRVSAQVSAQPSRVVSLGGGVTEIVYALGAQDYLVGTDQSSVFPQAARRLPSVGYYRRLPVEGVAALKPTLVIASEHAGPPTVLEQLRGLNIQVTSVSDAPTLASLQQRVREIALVLDRVDQGEEILTQFQSALNQAQSQFLLPRKAVTVVMRAGVLVGAGGDTTAGVVLREAGLINALSKQTGYRALSAEALSALAPEVIIISSGTVTSMGGLDAVKKSSLLRHTPAVKNNLVIEFDDLLVQGFSLRLPQAVSAIRQELSGATVR